MSASEEFKNRIKRYEKAQEKFLEKQSRVASAYKLSIPERDKWFTKSNSVDPSTRIYDDTAVYGVKHFASYILWSLANPMEQWINLKSTDTNKANAQSVDVKLQEISKKVYQVLSQSNFLLQADIALQDMAVSTGLLKIVGTGDQENPVKFEAIPLTDDVAFEEFDGQIENVWRKINIPGRNIMRIWKHAVLGNDLEKKIKDSPDEEVTLIECTIVNPDYDDKDKDSKRFNYYVMYKADGIDIVSEQYEISDWIPFRASVSPGSVWGDGPILQNLATIRNLNWAKGALQKSAGKGLAPPALYQADQIINPQNIDITLGEGAMIPVEDINNPPIKYLDMNHRMDLGELSLEEMKKSINRALFVDPIGEPGTVNTATEAKILEAQVARASMSLISRIQSEFLRPIVRKTLYYMRKSGAISDIRVNNKNIDIVENTVDINIELVSPLNLAKGVKDVQTFQMFYEIMQQVLADYAMGTVNIAELPSSIAKKLNIDLSDIASSQEIKTLVSSLTTQLSSQQTPQPQPNLQVPTQSGAGSVENQPFDLPA